jgi:hypothetical protein
VHTPFRLQQQIWQQQTQFTPQQLAEHQTQAELQQHLQFLQVRAAFFEQFSQVSITESTPTNSNRWWRRCARVCPACKHECCKCECGRRCVDSTTTTT